jgi:hypothetical protein
MHCDSVRVRSFTFSHHLMISRDTISCLLHACTLLELLLQAYIYSLYRLSFHFILIILLIRHLFSFECVFMMRLFLLLLRRPELASLHVSTDRSSLRSDKTNDRPARPVTRNKMFVYLHVACCHFNDNVVNDTTVRHEVSHTLCCQGKLTCPYGSSSRAQIIQSVVTI